MNPSRNVDDGPSVEQIALILRVTPDQVRRQFAVTAEVVSGMAAKAEATGKKVGGYTAAEHRAMEAKMARKAAPLSHRAK